MPNKIRVLILSDYPLSRTGLQRILASRSDLEVVADAATPNEIIERYSKFAPAVVLLETAAPESDGLRLAGMLIEKLPKLQMVVFTNNENPSYVRSMFAVGVLGYVLKRGTEEDVCSAIRRAATGRRFLDPGLSDSIVGILLLDKLERKTAANQQSRLSNREMQVLRRIAQGFTGK